MPLLAVTVAWCFMKRMQAVHDRATWQHEITMASSAEHLSLLRSICFTLLDILTSWSDRLMMTRGTVHKPCQFSVCILWLCLVRHHVWPQQIATRFCSRLKALQSDSSHQHHNCQRLGSSIAVLQTWTSCQECWYIVSLLLTPGALSKTKFTYQFSWYPAQSCRYFAAG